MRFVATIAVASGVLLAGAGSAVSVSVRGKRRLRVTGARAQRKIRVKHLPAGRYTVEVRVRTNDGRTVKAEAHGQALHAERLAAAPESACPPTSARVRARRVRSTR